MPAPFTERKQLMHYTIDIDQLLAEHRQIAIIWGIDDVKEVRPDLTDERAWEVLKIAKDGHDSSYGITWESLEWIAQDLFGDAPATTEAEE
jgi:hypothetical protein